MQHQEVGTLGHGPDGPVTQVVPARLGAVPLARRRAPVPDGPRRHRLRDAAESLARLGHPAIATVVDVVDVDDATIEVLSTAGDGGSLADLAGSRCLAPHELRSTLVPLCDALAAAHGAGVAHGHVTATNVVLHQGRPMLTDFALAEARTGRRPDRPFAEDVRALAALGTAVLDPADASADAVRLRTGLQRVSDDPAPTLAGLVLALEPGPGTEAPPPPPPPAVAAEQRPSAQRPIASRAALVGAAALLVGLLAGTAWVLQPDGQVVEAAAPACAPQPAALRADVDGDGCDEALEWRADVAEVAYLGDDDRLLRFRIGRPGDQLTVGDWDCDGTDTAGVVRPATGETFLFDAWAGEGQTLVAEPGPALRPGAQPVVVADGGCDRIEPAPS